MEGTGVRLTQQGRPRSAGMRRAPALRGTGLELGARTVRAVAPGALQAAFLGRAQGREPRATAAAAPRTRSDPLRGGVARPGGKARQRWHALVRPRAPARLLRARSALSGSSVPLPRRCRAFLFLRLCERAPGHPIVANPRRLSLRKRSIPSSLAFALRPHVVVPATRTTWSQ